MYQEDVTARVGRNDQFRIARGQHGFDCGNARIPWVRRARSANGVETGDHIIGCERRAIVKNDARAQRECPGCAIHRPAVGEQRHGLHGVVEFHHAFKHQRVEVDDIARRAINGVDHGVGIGHHAHRNIARAHGIGRSSGFRRKGRNRARHGRGQGVSLRRSLAPGQQQRKCGQKARQRQARAAAWARVIALHREFDNFHKRIIPY